MESLRADINTSDMTGHAAELETYMDTTVDAPVPPVLDQDACQPQRAYVEDATDVDDLPKHYFEHFPAAYYAGATHGDNQTSFDDVHDHQVLQHGEVWGPFQSEEQWQLAKWLVKNVGHNQAEEFLRLPIVRII